jgi:hypothetical protein
VPQRTTLTLQGAVTKAATFSGTPVDLTRLPGSGVLIVTLDITVAERDSADETYDFYITTSDGVSSWDVIHFPQVLTTGAKRFTARLLSWLQPITVTTAAPGVNAVDSGTLATGAGQLNVIKSLGAGLVRHGPWGSTFSHELVVAGTVATGISYSILITAAP